MNSSQLSK